MKVIYVVTADYALYDGNELEVEVFSTLKDANTYLLSCVDDFRKRMKGIDEEDSEIYLSPDGFYDAYMVDEDFENFASITIHVKELAI